MDLKKLRDTVLDDAVARFTASAGSSLRSVVLYGPAAHGDFYAGHLELNLLLVLADLELPTLATLQEPLSWWLKKDRPMPRVFSVELLRASADVFPMELSDLLVHRVVLHGDDPVPEMHIDGNHLRLQCEREMREKMMRLREAFIESRGKHKLLGRLLVESYPAFALIFRGMLRLRGNGGVPTHDPEMIDAFADWAGIDARPFHDVENARDGTGSTTYELFESYYTELRKAVAFVDTFVHSTGEWSS